MNVSLCQSIKKSQITGYDTISGILKKIQKGETQRLTELARSYGKHSVEYNKIKCQVQTFTPNASFSQRRDLMHLQEPSGFIYIDLDDYQDINFLKRNEYIYSCWRSLSGIGIGGLVKVNGITAQNFKDCWSYLFNYFRGYGITIDKQTCDITRQNVISFDPDIYINENAASLYADQITTQTSTGIQQFQDYKDSSRSALFSGFEETIITDTSRIKYRTTLDDYLGKNYVVIEDGKEFRSCFLPKEIRDGERHKWMVGHTVSLLFNNPTVTMEKLFNSVFHSNLTHCYPPMMNSEIMSIVKWYWEKHSRGMLDYHTKLKKIWFDPSVNINRNEKREIVGVETGRLRKEKTLKTLKSIYLELSSESGKVTQKMVVEKSKLSIGTVKKYWSNIIK
jgi:hypothetical protein